MYELMSVNDGPESDPSEWVLGVIKVEEQVGMFWTNGLLEYLKKSVNGVDFR